MLLIPCRQCARHLRPLEARCPFCGCEHPTPSTSASTAAAPPRARARLSRVALFSLGTSLAVSGCRTRPEELPVGRTTDDAGHADAGHADAGTRDAAGTDLRDLSPPVDSTRAFTDDGAQPIYGAPPRRDLGSPE